MLTLWWRAPEIFFGEREYTNAVDIWSLGCIFYELVTFEKLFSGQNEFEHIFQIYEIMGGFDQENYPDVVKYETFEQFKELYIQKKQEMRSEEEFFEFKTFKSLILEMNFVNLGKDLLVKMLRVDPK